ncbi:MAG TPA: hypothetical protein VF474_00370 [Phenylobacterium sp.]
MSMPINASLADFLPKEIDGLGEQMKEQLGKRGPSIGWSFIEGQAVEGLRSALKTVDVCEQLAQAWVTLGALRAYRDPDVLPAGETAVVPLGKHHLGFGATPVLKLKIGEVKLPDLKFTYAVKAAFDRATLSIRDHALVAAEPGDCAITTLLSCGKFPVHPPWTIATFQLPPQMQFSPGWKIP